MRAISLRSKEICHRSTRRSGRALFQALEQRQLLSLVGIALNNPPVIAFADNAQGSVAYSASTHDFTVSGGLTTSIPSGLLSLPGSATIDIKVDNSGSLIAGTPTSSDITVTDQTGTLLTGKAEAFGYLYQDASDAEFDFQFQVTGGSMAPQFAAQDIGVQVFADFSNFSNTFTTDFTTNNKSYLGPVPAPSHGPSSPTLTTTASLQNGNDVVGSAIPQDSAVLAGGNSETGNITFTLTDQNGNTIDQEIIAANGDGTYSTSNTNIATTVGTYTWSVAYAGDANNSPAVDQGGAAEQVSVVTASPSINTSQQPATASVGGAIADQATVSGGYNPSGTVTFNLYSNPNGTGTPLFTDTEALVGGVATSSSYTTTVTGNDYWVATYNGDSNNSPVASGLADEPVVISPVSPSINTSQQPATAVVGSSVADQATVSGGYNATGTVTFNLYNNAAGTGTPLFSDTEVLVNGVATSAGYTATATGTDYWVAVYNGDTNNISATSPATSEPVTITQASPSISTAPGTTTTTVSTVSAGQFATIGFWHNKNGQAVINSFNGSSSSTQLGNWLANNFPNLFGAANPYLASSLAGKTNAQVATAFANTWTPSGVTKNTYVQAFAVALGLYADNTALGYNSTAAGFGFVGTAGGAGSYNIGSNGSAFGVSNNTNLTVFKSLQIVDANFNSTTGTFYGGDQTKTSSANNVLNGINTTGDIGGSGSGTISTGVTVLTDSATLTGGFNPAGTITFQLFAPDGTTVVYTDTVIVAGDGVYNTSAGTNPGGYTPTASGTYQWVATYNGDVNNVSVAGKMGDEPETVGSTCTPPPCNPGCGNNNSCDNNNNNNNCTPTCNNWCNNNNSCNNQNNNNCSSNNNNWCDNNNSSCGNQSGCQQSNNNCYSNNHGCSNNNNYCSNNNNNNCSSNNNGWCSNNNSNCGGNSYGCSNNSNNYCSNNSYCGGNSGYHC